MAATGTPWFKVFSQLRSHPKLEDLAASLNLPRVHALGHMVSLWCWVVDYAADGDISAQTPGRIARGAEWTGDPDLFVSSLIDAGLVDANDGAMLVHNWLVYAESYKRAESQREKREKAAKKDKPKRKRKQVTTPVPVQQQYSTDTVPALSGDSTVHVTLRGEEKSGEEKSREETILLPAPSATPSTPKVKPEISIPLVDKTDYDIDAKQIADWSESFPGIDVLQELRKAREWSLSNPTKRKTAKGIRRHLTAWLSSAQDKGGGQSGQRSQPANVGYHPGSPASEFVTGIVKL